MDLGLKNKVALVTASSSGLGREAALVLAEEGAEVIITSRSEENLINAKQYIKEKTLKEVEFYICNLNNEESRRNLVSKVIGKHSTIDILVNNNGGPPGGTFEDFSEQNWITAFQNNFISVQSMVQMVLPIMKKKKWGRIVNISSISIKEPIDGLILSNGVRAGLNGMMKTLSREIAGDNVLINTVAPGYHNTERVQKLAQSIAEKQGKTPEEVIENLENNIPMGRMGEPSELAYLIAFLASEKASYITGTTIQCDGGAVKSLI